MKIKLTKTYLLIVVFILTSTPFNLTLAANFSVSPLIIDIETEARDSLSKTITLTSQQNNSLRLFASVHEITLGDESEIKSFVPASMSDRTTSPTSWIQVSRARIDLKSDEKREIPVTIKINPNTLPGLYHAYIGFAPGPNRDVAEATILAGQGSGVVIRILVGGKQEEFLRLVSFRTDRFSYKDSKGEIVYVLENTGDVPLSPKGDIIIYDSQGRELTTLELNQDETKVINPGETLEYRENLPFINHIGKNKAFLSLDYGKENRASVYDTNFYYSIPWLYMLVIMLLLATVLTVLIILFRRSTSERELTEPEAYDLPLYVRDNKDHSEYEHDIDLKKKDS